MAVPVVKSEHNPLSSTTIKLYANPGSDRVFEFEVDEHPLGNLIQAGQSDKVLNVDEFLRLQPGLTALNIDFSELRGISVEDVYAIDEENPSISAREEKMLVIKQMIELSNKTWSSMKDRGHDTAEDTPEMLLDIFTRPSTRVSVIRATPKTETSTISTKSDRFAGFAIIILDKPDFPDLQDLPPELMERDDVARGLRVILNDLASILAPGNKAGDKLMREVSKVAPGKVIYTKVLIDPPELAYRWSRVGLERVGFYDTGLRCSQDTNANGKDCKVTFAWYAYSPDEGKTKSKIDNYNKRVKELSNHATRQFAETFAHFDPSGSRLAVYSQTTTDEQILQFADVQPDNWIVNVDLIRKGTPDYRPNLVQMPFERAETALQPGSFNGIINLNFIPAYISEKRAEGYKQFTKDLIIDFLKKQSELLSVGGRSVNRVWAVPDMWPQKIVIELNTEDGTNEGDLLDLSLVSKFSTARRFEAYAKQLGDVQFEEISASRSGQKAFVVSKFDAYSFSVVKDYTEATDWKREISKKVAYTASELAEYSKIAGNRNISLIPHFNPVIHENSFQGHLVFKTLSGRELPFPATMYTLVSEKVAAGQSVSLDEVSLRKVGEPKFIETAVYRNEKSGVLRDVATRPLQTIEFHIFYEKDGIRYAVFNDDFPRPIAKCSVNSPSLDGSETYAYVAQPFSGLYDKNKNFDKEVLRILNERANISADDILSLDYGSPYFTSPGSNDELVRRVFVKVTPRSFTEHEPARYTDFALGRIRAVPELRMIQSAQEGRLGDDRVTRNIYELLLKDSMPTGPWLSKITSSEQEIDPARVVNARDYLARQFEGYQEGKWRKLEPREIPYREPYLSVYEATFNEVDGRGNVISTGTRELLRPSVESGISSNTVATIAFCKSGGKIYIIPEMQEELPVPYLTLGMNRLVTEFGIRIPENTTEPDDYVIQMLTERHNLTALNGKLINLGSSFLPSAGLLSEEVTVKAIEISASNSKGPLIALDDLLENRDNIYCGHLLTGLFRLNHATKV